MVLPQYATTVTVTTATVTGQDAYGKDVITYVDVPSPGWVLWPAMQGAEATQGQDLITDVLVGLAPAGTVLSAVGRVKVAGLPYEVTGAPYDWSKSPNPFTGTVPGVSVNLKRVTG